MTPRELRQLRRLTRPLAGARSTACAITVYAEPETKGAASSRLAPRIAREQGFEGVACVDDAARAIVLYAHLWRRHQMPSARATATGLLRFLAHMQDDDGRFGNFIVDWSGQRNTNGDTSIAGGPAWQARALHALACGVAILGVDEWDERFKRARPWIDDAMPYLDVRAVCVLAMLEHWRATGDSESADRALAWSRDIARHASALGLLNAAGEQSIHCGAPARARARRKLERSSANATWWTVPVRARRRCCSPARRLWLRFPARAAVRRELCHRRPGWCCACYRRRTLRVRRAARPGMVPRPQYRCTSRSTTPARAWCLTASTTAP